MSKTTLTIGLISSLILWLLLGCSKEPSESKFEEMIKTAKKYPAQNTNTLDVGSPQYALVLQRSPLAKKGLLTVNNVTSRQDGTQYVQFTEAAKPYLVGTVERVTDTQFGIVRLKQKVITHSTEFGKITRVRFNEAKDKAVVEYEEVTKSVTPFADDLIKEGAAVAQRAYFVKYEDGWRIKLNPSLDLLAL